MSEPILDADGQPIRAGQYNTCPICNLHFREPTQDAEGLTEAHLTGDGQVILHHTEAWHAVMSAYEDRLRAHVTGHSAEEIVTTINDLQAKVRDLQTFHDDVIAQANANEGRA